MPASPACDSTCSTLAQCRGTGVATGRSDLVIAANVLHATADIKATVAHARSLLKPTGLLLAVEGTGFEPWVDHVRLDRRLVAVLG